MSILSSNSGLASDAIDTFGDKRLYAIEKHLDHLDNVRESILDVAQEVKWNSMITFTQGSTRHFDALKMEREVIETIRRVEISLSHYYTSHDSHRIEDFANKYPKSYFKRQWNNGKIKPYYLLAIEPHQSGHPHAHLLISHSRQQHKPNYCIELWQNIWRTCSPNGGSVDVSPVTSTDPTAAIKYCTKYLLKGGDCTTFTMHLPFEIENHVPL